MAQHDRSHESRIQGLEQWRDGNGALGAEQRIQKLEGNMVTEARVKELIGRASADTAQSVVDRMSQKGHHKYRDIVLGVAALSGVGGLIAQIVAQSV